MGALRKRGRRPLRAPSEIPEGSDPDQDIRNLIDAGKLDAAVRELMKRHGNAVYRYCREELRDATLAHDVQLQTFIEAHRDLKRFEGRGSLRSWLFGIAHYRILDAAKVLRRNRTRIAQDDCHDAADSRPRADEQIDDARLVEVLRKCLGKLGERARAAVLLRFQQGLTFQEMAEILHERPGTLQARVQRALPALRECVETLTGGAV